MKSYYSISPDTGLVSGVQGYEYGSDYITLYFRNGGCYTYTYDSCGAVHVDMMKQLADMQKGLSTYVTKNKPQYSSKM